MSDPRYLVIVARVDDGKVVFSRPGAWIHQQGSDGHAWAERQLRSGLKFVDTFVEGGGHVGEDFETFAKRLK